MQPKQAVEYALTVMDKTLEGEYTPDEKKRLYAIITKLPGFMTDVLPYLLVQTEENQWRATSIKGVIQFEINDSPGVGVHKTYYQAKWLLIENYYEAPKQIYPFQAGDSNIRGDISQYVIDKDIALHVLKRFWDTHGFILP